MLPAHDLRILRGEVARVLAEIQQLRGFSERFARLPRPPEGSNHWTWKSVLLAGQGTSPSSTRWEWLPSEDVDSGVAHTARQTDGHSIDSVDGELLRVPVADPTPSTATIQEIETYRDAIADFARRYVLGAEWSPRAVHNAIRGNGVVRLPQAPPRPWLQVSAEIQLQAGHGAPVSPGIAEAISAALADAEPHPEIVRYARERDRLDREVVDILEREATKRAELKYLARQFRRLRALYGRDEHADAGKELRPHARDAMWEGAVEHISYRLKEKAPPNKTPSSSASRAKLYMNAAVNGVFDSPIPAEPSDAVNYFTELRPLLREAAKAIQVAYELSDIGKKLAP